MQVDKYFHLKEFYDKYMKLEAKKCALQLMKEKPMQLSVENHKMGVVR